jgi:hypothetical protein
LFQSSKIEKAIARFVSKLCISICHLGELSYLQIKEISFLQRTRWQALYYINIMKNNDRVRDKFS